MLQVRNPEQVALLAADFQLRREPNFAWKSACSAFLALPGLRGFWPMSSFDENGDAFDLSGQGRILTYNGNPTYNFDGLVPYIDLDGTGDYLSRADEAGLDILGTESYVAPAVRGLTLGGWFWPDTLSGPSHGLIGKWNSASQRAYLLLADVVATMARPAFMISDDGSWNAGHYCTIPHTETIIQAWGFIIGRLNTSTNTIAAFLNGTKVQAACNYNIFNSTADLAVGALHGGTDLFTGRASMCFLCAAALSDSVIGALFQQTRAMYGV